MNPNFRLWVFLDMEGWNGTRVGHTRILKCFLVSEVLFIYFLFLKNMLELFLKNKYKKRSASCPGPDGVNPLGLSLTLIATESLCRRRKSLQTLRSLQSKTDWSRE